ncbi:hypothetical protein D9X91_03950 [Falsibacillus albus]|uniref:Uncharacterized protein n=1 Tax=Falsibacillus albus TaxID=2478915 RepID=A0A3L7K3A8_9BACI|nr:hypothetical protein D9X91_03950 [Falsibacillus albus]
MNVKPHQMPRSILKLEALIRNLPPNFHRAGFSLEVPPCSSCDAQQKNSGCPLFALSFNYIHPF